VLSDFHKFFVVRIGLISLLVSTIAGLISYYVIQDNMIETTKSLAIQDSKRALDSDSQAYELTPENIYDHAKEIPGTLVGGLFEHADVYDAHEVLIAEAGVFDEKLRGSFALSHQLPNTKNPIANLQVLKNREWVLNIFLPIKVHLNGQSVLVGYIQLIRHVPQWRIQILRNLCLKMALLTFGLALLFAVLLYPFVIKLFKSFKTKLDEVHTSHILLLEALGRAIAMRDSNTGVHNFRVTYISVKIAESLSLGREVIQRIILGSFLHDIGKIPISDSILLKKGALNQEERSKMQAHVEYGSKIIGDAGWLRDANIIIANHHEKWDGSGYPKGLHEDQIPIEARIFAVADVFDALCSKRPYKEPLNYRDAIHIMYEGDGTHFDPQVIEAFKLIAHEVYDFIASVSEADGKQILDKLIRKYFE
jgi:HD-GYP domain-containing protein (c-di-GMP phosphodiesterase class II)